MIKIDVEKICDEISNKSFNVVNPKNTHEDIAVVKVLDVLNILSKYTNNKEE